LNGQFLISTGRCRMARFHGHADFSISQQTGCVN
jgi:hypothetical protein